MDFKFNKESDDTQQLEASGEKKKQSALLVLLLILIGGFIYIYFFTGLIKPQETQKTAEAPLPAPQVIKMPLPPREGESAKPSEKTAETTEAPKAAATATVVAAAPAAKPAAAPPKPAASPAAKAAPASAQSKQNEEPKKVDTAKPADKKPQMPPVADKNGEKAAALKAETKKPATDVKKPAEVSNKIPPVKGNVKKAASGASAKHKTVVKTRKTTPDSWTLIVGNYVLEEALSADMGRVREAGFEPIVKPSSRKKTTMNRLFVSEFNDRAAARSTMEKLKRHTSDAFVIEQGSKFVVYAGSYLQGEAAATEKERLKGAGISVSIKHADVAIPAQSLSIGPFNSKKTADSALGKLINAGIKATLSLK